MHQNSLGICINAAPQDPPPEILIEGQVGGQTSAGQMGSPGGPDVQHTLKTQCAE